MLVTVPSHESTSAVLSRRSNTQCVFLPNAEVPHEQPLLPRKFPTVAPLTCQFDVVRFVGPTVIHALARQPVPRAASLQPAHLFLTVPTFVLLGALHSLQLAALDVILEVHFPPGFVVTGLTVTYYASVPAVRVPPHWCFA